MSLCCGTAHAVVKSQLHSGCMYCCFYGKHSGRLTVAHCVTCIISLMSGSLTLAAWITAFMPGTVTGWQWLHVSLLSCQAQWLAASVHVSLLSCQAQWQVDGGYMYHCFHARYSNRCMYDCFHARHSDSLTVVTHITCNAVSLFLCLAQWHSLTVAILCVYNINI